MARLLRLLWQARSFVFSVYRGLLAGRVPVRLSRRIARPGLLESVRSLSPVMEAQIINYLKLSKLPVGCLLSSYGTKVEWKRFVDQQ